VFNIHFPREERIWLMIGIATLAIFLVLFGIMAFGMGLQPPGHMMQIEPKAVTATPPFDHPGITQIGDNEYEANIVAQVFMFNPGDITLPVGAKVHFKVTTPDVVHGLYITDTNVNMMAVPGHITEFTYTFRKPGEYLVLCHEYCGIGHQLMMGQIHVQ